MEKIRVLYCIDSIGDDAGPDKQIAELVRHIDKSRFEVHLACFEESDRLRKLEEHCTALVLPFRSVWTLSGWRQIRCLRCYINDRGIHIVHTWMVKANIAGVLAARGAKCKAIVSSRRNLGYWMRPFHLRLLRYLDRYTTRLLANAERVKEFVIAAERVPAQKVDVLYNGVDMTEFAPGCGDPSVPRSLGIPDAAKVIGIVANLRPVKDHALFLRAARVVADAVPDAVFLLVGTGPLLRDLTTLAAELGLSGRVFFSKGLGRVQDYLGRMCVGCLSSQSEGFSNAILEYMAAGLPVVATDVGGNAEAVETGVSGYIVPYGDAAALAEPMIKLLRDDTLRERMGRAALDRCRRLFEMTVAVGRYEEYYVRRAEEAYR